MIPLYKQVSRYLYEKDRMGILHVIQCQNNRQPNTQYTLDNIVAVVTTFTKTLREVVLPAIEGIFQSEGVEKRLEVETSLHDIPWWLRGDSWTITRKIACHLEGWSRAHNPSDDAGIVCLLWIKPRIKQFTL